MWLPLITKLDFSGTLIPDASGKETLLKILKLTSAEKKKKEEIVKGMKKSFKGDKEDMYAIATSKAKKVAEELAKKLKNK